MRHETQVSEPSEVKAVANQMLDWADSDGIAVSPMKLQKLVYFNHAAFIVAKSRPLIAQSFEAWEHGPVCPSLYAEFKRFKDRAITSRAEKFDPVSATKVIPLLNLGEEDQEFVRERYDFYKKFSVIALSELSHSRAGPWRYAKSLFANGLNPNRDISNDLIRDYHRLFDS